MPPVAATAARPPHELRLVAGCAFASMASMRICDAMLPAIGTEFGATPGQAARTIGAFALAYGVLQLFYGSLGDRYGKLRVIGCATLACTLGNGLAAGAQALDWLVAARALSGAAAAGIIPLAMAWIGDGVAYENRQAVLAQLLGATVFGMICGQWLGGMLAQTLGWRAAFVLLALAFAASGGWLLRRSMQGAGATHAPAGGGTGLLRGLRAAAAARWARVVLSLTLAEGALGICALAFVPVFLHWRFGLSMPAAGGLVAFYGLGGLAYSRGARRMLRRWGEAGLARVGGICTALAYGAVALAPSWHWVPPACLLAGFGFYALHNTLQTHATQMLPQARGTGMSLFACCLFLGQSLGVAAAAWLVDRQGAQAVFAIAGAGLLLLGMGFAQLLDRREHR